MPQKKLIAATVICIILIAYATLTKLAGRPALVGHHEAYWIVVIERFSAYGLLGCLLAFLLPGRIFVASVPVALVAVLLEALQVLIPSRDAEIFDVIQKVAGGITGVLLAQTILGFLPRVTR
ncbi:VanZ family protein [Bradyrhizobium sp. JYMT SZCCT0428]|uniref:VanZ family protein n=1 Tax=Bradyrhizobium sp. JYMT SZCCT0428 TaxID=2807673 RepID=UPI001BAB385D|nr:VanZ family protein [Bradyrhizobium sp. JYMT SZCCT0428]MBR1154588.1 VanZ family protein [Bradyrhizobium sp. JYMT SZCCT0428]